MGAGSWTAVRGRLGRSSSTDSLPAPVKADLAAATTSSQSGGAHPGGAGKAPPPIGWGGTLQLGLPGRQLQVLAPNITP